MTTSELQITRRPIRSRSKAWAHKWAATLTILGMTPNQVSLLSMVAAGIAAALLVIGTHDPAVANRSITFLLSAAFVQIRLICNLLDGLMAVEGGKKSAVGELYNEFPDRVSDSVILVAMGHACNAGTLGIELGWLSALLAALTAYIRVFGGNVTGAQDFCGPMAKQHRMFVVTMAILLGVAIQLNTVRNGILLTGLVIIAIGSTITCIRRIKRIGAKLKQPEVGCR